MTLLVVRIVAILDARSNEDAMSQRGNRARCERRQIDAVTVGLAYNWVVWAGVVHALLNLTRPSASQVNGARTHKSVRR